MQLKTVGVWAAGVVFRVYGFGASGFGFSVKSFEAMSFI